MKKLFSSSAALLLAVGASLVVPGSAGATEPYCGITWGSTGEQSVSSPLNETYLVDVRAGRHECFDRLVVDIEGFTGTYSVEYVDEVTGIGSGLPIPLRGDAELSILVESPAYDEDGDPTYDPDNQRELVDTTGYETFRQVAWAGSFEGQSKIGLGVRARLPFRTFFLTGPGETTRVVVDVAHRW
ncbi:AMIN-like domain-containing (lipo)protein [Kocuria kalidii]|uniref:AMIN-like domain-containing (lipo)protein n=1 Tax=Kocuria kalidii TaxID=3376283 RepID=UPI0037A87CD3